MYRLSALSRSSSIIDTYYETIVLKEIVSTFSNERFCVGEQDPDELDTCLLNPSTRRIEQIIVSNATDAENLFDTLMGTNVAARRDWLLTHAEETPDE